MSYVIKRIGRGGGYVTRQGSASSYTLKLQNARRWPTRKAAENARCTENEIVLHIEDTQE